MSLIEVLLLANGTGVLGMGAGIFKWAFSVEKRLIIIETKQGSRKNG
jgi:hypothetical protein